MGDTRFEEKKEHTDVPKGRRAKEICEPETREDEKKRRVNCATWQATCSAYRTYGTSLYSARNQLFRTSSGTGRQCLTWPLPLPARTGVGPSQNDGLFQELYLRVADVTLLATITPTLRATSSALLTLTGPQGLTCTLHHFPTLAGFRIHALGKFPSLQ